MNEPGLETSSGPRGFYYDRLRVPGGDYSTNPLSPSGKSNLRAELMHKEGKLFARAGDKLALYMTKPKVHSAQAAATLGRAEPADKTKLLTDRRVQDLSADCGSRRSMQTNIVDLGAHINNNMLRFHKHQGFTNVLPLDGGWRYTPNVCTGNFVEERRERGYASGFHARELGLSQIYQTEQTARYKPPTEQYYNRVMAENPTAKFPPRDASKVPKGNECDGHNLYYCEGFGDKPHMDHTIPANRGGYWVGTAPTRKNDSIAATAAKGESLEFQKRCSVYDPSAKILATSSRPMDMTDRATQRVVQSLAESQRFTSTWKTSYSLDYKDMSRSQSAQFGTKPVFKDLGAPRPITAAAGAN